MINVVERINELMRLKKWTAYELSNQTGISTNTIYDWNKIGATPTMHSIISICDAMDISLEQFFCGGEYRYSDEENAVLAKWVGLTDAEKVAVLNLMKTFNLSKSRL